MLRDARRQKMSARRWATFDCYGTLIDWRTGIRDALSGIWPAEYPDDLLEVYHRLEPQVESAGSPKYRQVLEQCLVPDALRALRARGRRIAILSNCDADLLESSIRNLGVEPDLTITVEQSGSYKPAHGHWTAFRVRADPDVHIHVAQSLFHDIAPCADLCIPAVWINRLAEVSDLPRVAELADLQGLARTLDAFLR